LLFSHIITSSNLLYQYTLSYHRKKLKKEKTFSENMNFENAASKSILQGIYKLNRKEESFRIVFRRNEKKSIYRTILLQALIYSYPL